jgi:hypothetical protein
VVQVKVRHEHGVDGRRDAARRVRGEAAGAGARGRRQAAQQREAARVVAAARVHAAVEHDGARAEAHDDAAASDLLAGACVFFGFGFVCGGCCAFGWREGNNPTANGRCERARCRASWRRLAAQLPVHDIAQPKNSPSTSTRISDIVARVRAPRERRAPPRQR